MTTAHNLLEDYYRDCPEPTWFDRYIAPIMIGFEFFVTPPVFAYAIVTWVVPALAKMLTGE